MDIIDNQNVNTNNIEGILIRLPILYLSDYLLSKCDFFETWLLDKNIEYLSVFIITRSFLILCKIFKQSI